MSKFQFEFFFVCLFVVADGFDEFEFWENTLMVMVVQGRSWSSSWGGARRGGPSSRGADGLNDGVAVGAEEVFGSRRARQRPPRGRQGHREARRPALRVGRGLWPAWLCQARQGPLRRPQCQHVDRPQCQDPWRVGWCKCLFLCIVFSIIELRMINTDTLIYNRSWRRFYIVVLRMQLFFCEYVIASIKHVDQNVVRIRWFFLCLLVCLLYLISWDGFLKIQNIFSVFYLIYIAFSFGG